MMTDEARVFQAASLYIYTDIRWGEGEKEEENDDDNSNNDGGAIMSQGKE